MLVIFAIVTFSLLVGEVNASRRLNVSPVLIKRILYILIESVMYLIQIGVVYVPLEL